MTFYQLQFIVSSFRLLSRIITWIITLSKPLEAQLTLSVENPQHQANNVGRSERIPLVKATCSETELIISSLDIGHPLTEVRNLSIQCRPRCNHGTRRRTKLRRQWLSRLQVVRKSIISLREPGRKRRLQWADCLVCNGLFPTGAAVFQLRLSCTGSDAREAVAYASNIHSISLDKLREVTSTDLRSTTTNLTWHRIKVEMLLACP